VQDYTVAIQLNPKYLNAYKGRAAAFYGKGDNDKAIADLTENIRINPNDATAYHLRGFVYERIGERYKAEDDFAQAKKLGYKGK
jgi:Flp pilus assembly protein TadD